MPVERNAENDEQNDTNNADREILAIHVGACTFLNGERNLLHALVASRLLENPLHGYEAVQNRKNARAYGKPQSEFICHQIVS